jgi:hypothetical protein
VRNRIVQAGYERMVKAKPANLFTQSAASLVSVGNLEDDFDAAVGASDWIIEVIVERPGPKQALMARIERSRRPAPSSAATPPASRSTSSRGAHAGVQAALPGHPLLQPAPLFAPAGDHPDARHRPGHRQRA